MNRELEISNHVSLGGALEQSRIVLRGYSAVKCERLAGIRPRGNRGHATGARGHSRRCVRPWPQGSSLETRLEQLDTAGDLGVSRMPLTGRTQKFERAFIALVAQQLRDFGLEALLLNVGNRCRTRTVDSGEVRASDPKIDDLCIALFVSRTLHRAHVRTGRLEIVA